MRTWMGEASMRALGILLLGVSLVACQASEEAGPSDNAESTPTAAAPSPSPTPQGEPAGRLTSPAAPASLAGEYRVAGIDGESLNADFGIALSISDSRISYEPECAGFVWDYTYEAGVLTTERSAGHGPERQPDGPTAVCAVAVAPELRQLGQAIDAVASAERTPANAIELSGGGRSVTLFTQ
jgi:hypothetical protein